MAYTAPTVSFTTLLPWLPGTVNLESFIDVQITSAGSLNPGAPGNIYDAWCLDRSLGISPGGSTAKLYSSYELAILQASPLGSVTFAQAAYINNLDNINWLLNQDFNAGPTYSWKEVQGAIWTLTGSNATNSGSIAGADATKITALVNLAMTNGDGFVPGLGQTIGLILDTADPNNGSRTQPLILEVKSAALGDFVWNDANADGIQDTGEAGIQGVTVRLVRDLDKSGNITADEVLSTTTTNSSGLYSFTGLTPGLDYQVQFTQPIGLTPSPRQVDGNPSSGVNSDGLLSNVVVLAPGENNTSVDAGFHDPNKLNASLGDRVWVDANGDGKQDPNTTLEPGVQGAVVTLIGGGADGLINGVGDTAATTTTDANGVYAFTGLTPGVEYQVQFTAPNGTVFTTPNVSANGLDTTDSDADKVSGKTQLVTLAPGENNPTLDAGVYTPAKLSGYVYADTGNDGVRNNEPAIANVTLTLTGTDNAGNSVTATTTTNSAGFYEFVGLPPGNYTVTETQPTAFLDGKDSIGSTGGTVSNDVLSNITLVSGANSVENNFGEIPTASLGDRLWLDANGDGKQTDGEAGISGQTVTLIGGGADGLINGVGDITSTTSTDANGNYTFTGLTPGMQYQVQFTAPGGTVFTTPNVSANGLDTTDSDADRVTGRTQIVTLAQGENNPTLDAGVYAPGKLTGFVYVDSNDDGSRAGEAPIQGVTLTLSGVDNAGNVITGVTTVSEPNGFYEFTNLAPGSYTVTETQPANFNDGKDSVGTTGGSNAVNDVLSGIAVTAGGVSNENNFGERLQTASLGDRLWVDTNGDGKQDANTTLEPGVVGATVTLIGGGADGLISTTGDNTSTTTTTGANGVYAFTGLTPGVEYQVQFAAPNGTVFTTPNVSANGLDTTDSDADKISGKTQIVKLAPGENNPTLDAGVYTPAKLSGYVYVDTGNDGVRNGDPAIANVKLTLTGTDNAGNSVTATTTTNAVGFYEFVGLAPGNYTVTETQPTAYADGKDSIGTTGGTVANDVLSNITLVSGANSAENNFGELYKGQIGNLVWLDTNGNGLKDTGEGGAAGVVVSLRTGTTVLATQTTDANGNYLFTSLDAGSYNVQFGTLPGYVFTAKDTGSNDSIDSDSNAAGQTINYTLNPGDANLTVDAGLVAAPKGSLGNFLWYDKNANGIQDSGEAGIAGVKVDLYKDSANNVLVGTTTTDASGKYLFTGLDAGSYHVDVQEGTLPSGSVFTKPLAGTDRALDSNVTTRGGSVQLAQGVMDVVQLARGETNVTQDAGVYKIGIDVEKYVSGTRTTTTNTCGGEGANVKWWKDNCSNGWGWTGQACKGTDSFNSIFGVNCNGGTRSLYSILCGTSTASYDVWQRECIAAYLNACHAKVDYAYSKDQVVSDVKHALNSCKYDDCGAKFKSENDLGCGFTSSKDSYTSTVDTQLYDADTPPGLEVKIGSLVTFTYIVKNTGDTALKNVVLTDDRIQTVTYVSGDTDRDGQLDLNETWTYKATETASAGTIKNTGTVRAVDAVGGVSSVTDKDDAYYTGTGALKGSLGDRVFIDKDGDGVQDSGEVGLAGVKVTLKGAGTDGAFGTADDVVATTTTSSTGAYLFPNLQAGKYEVDFSDATRLGYKITRQDQGTNNAADSDASATTGKTAVITLGAGEQNLTVDAGVYQLASVGDRVWEDSIHNNVQDAQEFGIPNIKVSLLSSSGAVLATTVTNNNGNYLFSNLDPGVYSLRFDKTNVTYISKIDGRAYSVNGWKWAVKDSGSNDAIDSDATGDARATTHVTVTSQFSLTSGQNDMTKDAGLTPIVINLDGHGIQTISRTDSGGTFDLFGNGQAISSGWIARGSGFLAVDKNANGKIDDISELFGGTAKGAGFSQLAGYDSNHDGLVDAKDAGFDKLLIWQDVNGNHRTDADELMTLAQAGIDSLRVSYVELPFIDAQGNLHLERSSATLSSGTSVSMTDVYLNVSAADAKAAGVVLPSMAELLGSDNMDTLVGPAAAATTDVAHTQAEAHDEGSDGGEALRRLAAAHREDQHFAS